ncbi:MAG TPA: carbamoyltransferase HypF, partial [Paucimonas sp.]|nr:carbamoyltransferase HypF [Paucimonas sp.]
SAQTVQAMLTRNLNCPPATGAGRWFDAAAGALGISVRQEFEAQAAMALEKLAAAWLELHGDTEIVTLYGIEDDGVLDLRPLFRQLFAMADSGDAREIARGAALFHTTLASALAEWAAGAARQRGVRAVALGGGCFFNRVMTSRLCADLDRRGLQVFLPQTVSCGDAGLALGQAWAAAHQLAAVTSPETEAIVCV